MITVYALIDPRDKIVRYVGRTSNPRRRIAGHVSVGTTLHPAAQLKNFWVAELAAVGMRPRMRTLQRCVPSRAQATEQRWIQRYAGPLLLNRAPAAKYPGLARYGRSERQVKCIVRFTPAEFSLIEKAKTARFAAQWIRRVAIAAASDDGAEKKKARG